MATDFDQLGRGCIAIGMLPIRGRYQVFLGIDTRTIWWLGAFTAERAAAVFEEIATWWQASEPKDAAAVTAFLGGLAGPDEQPLPATQQELVQVRCLIGRDLRKRRQVERN